MRKLYPYLAAIPIVVFALFPPIELSVPMTEQKVWVWLVLVSGFWGFCISFFDINMLVKLLIPFLFVSCFFSAAPPLCFTAYIFIVLCAYFYILCTKIDNWTPIIKALQVVILLNLILLFMQRIGRDSLCNFGLKEITCGGSVGNLMQLKSFFIIASGVLIALTKPRILRNKRVLFSLGAIVIVWVTHYFVSHKICQYFLYARGPVWLATLKLWMRHPFFGWGPGLYKIIFPALARGLFEHEGVWRTAHNCWLQMLLEIGSIGFSLVSGFFIYLFIKLRRIDLYLFFGLMVIALDMSVHFSTRQIQCVFIMIMFLAHCEQKIKEKKLCPTPQALT